MTSTGFEDIKGPGVQVGILESPVLESPPWDEAATEVVCMKTC